MLSAKTGDTAIHPDNEKSFNCWHKSVYFYQNLTFDLGMVFWRKMSFWGNGRLAVILKTKTKSSLTCLKTYFWKEEQVLPSEISLAAWENSAGSSLVTSSFNSTKYGDGAFSSIVTWLRAGSRKWRCSACFKSSPPNKNTTPSLC